MTGGRVWLWIRRVNVRQHCTISMSDNNHSVNWIMNTGRLVTVPSVGNGNGSRHRAWAGSLVLTSTILRNSVLAWARMPLALPRSVAVSVAVSWTVADRVPLIIYRPCNTP